MSSTTTSESTTVSPPEEDLNKVVTSLKKEHPALGVAKLHTLLLSAHPLWTVSEKRLRRILKSLNSDGPLAQTGTRICHWHHPGGPGPSSKVAHVFPSS